MTNQNEKKWAKNAPVSDDWINDVKKFSFSQADLSKDADLSIGLMNLISLEEHLAFSFAKTFDEKYLTMLSTIREIRKEFMKKLIRNPSAEEWCISKHLLAASMRLLEVGTKELDSGNESEAANYFSRGFEVYSLFMGLALDLPLQEKGSVSEKVKKNNPGLFRGSNPSVGIVETIKKLVDCCKE